MQEDEEGFLYPHIVNESECINCKRCLNVCPEKSAGRQPNQPQNSFGGYVNEELAVKGSSSGGFSTAIGKAFGKKGGVVYGVRYSEDCLSIVYDRADCVEAMERFRTSKYAQAYKQDVYTNVKQDLKDGRKVLFVGLPCEVSALYHFVKDTENLYTISLICHGPTSQKVHRQFCEGILKTNGADSIITFSQRHKKTGWKPYYLVAKFDNGAEYSQEFNKSEYDVAFKYLKRPSCSVCQYKLGNAEFGLVADLVLGDYHSVRTNSPGYNSWGVSQATILTEKGKELMGLIKEQCSLVPISQKEIASTNIALRAPVPLKKYRSQFAAAFTKKGLHVASKHPLVQFEIKKNKTKRKLKRFLVKVRNIVLHR
jgi:coenzyme F420-reducing hydrogenase beta subunit